MILGLNDISRPVYFTTDAFLRHLGMSDAEIGEASRLANEMFPPDEPDSSDDSNSADDHGPAAVSDARCP